VSAKEPRPAACVILLRRGGRHSDRGLEVLMARRNAEARFMPDVWVFPGGGVTDEDRAAAEDAASREEDAHRLCAARELAEEVGIELGPEPELVPWSRWITPELAPVRFDTRFYVALAPAHASPKADGGEVVDVRWLGPAAALEGHTAGELKLVFPTIKHLEGLVDFSSGDELMSAAREKVVEPVLPRVVGDETSWRVVLPGDPEY
jgi:8-oxo-dGTP pyrophosphatase MutT (NUDIX family)